MDAEANIQDSNIHDSTRLPSPRRDNIIDYSPYPFWPPRDIDRNINHQNTNTFSRHITLEDLQAANIPTRGDFWHFPVSYSDSVRLHGAWAPPDEYDDELLSSNIFGIRRATDNITPTPLMESSDDVTSNGPQPEESRTHMLTLADMLVPPGSNLSQFEPEPTTPTSVVEVACDACMEVIIGHKITLDCGCSYDAACLDQLVLAACSSVMAFPPKCCGHILNYPIFQRHLSMDTFNRWLDTQQQWSSLGTLYCAQPTCSMALNTQPSESTGSHYFRKCLECGKSTCEECKQLRDGHRIGLDGDLLCPPEPAGDAALRQLGETENWRQCPWCDSMVERVDGCDHMHCVCGAGFCYLCGSFLNMEGSECVCMDRDM